MTSRIFFVGTNTGIGKTALVCALLHWARKLDTTAIPFKPAQSGDDGSDTDIDRLLRAAGRSPDDAACACPLSYPEPLAPGLAEDPEPFFRPPAANADPLPDILDLTQDRLATWEMEHDPDLVFIEGAGGLHVPMPGGTWQPEWIHALAEHVVVVGSTALGTINHTLLTLDALEARGLSVLGLYLVDPDNDEDPSRRDNAQVIATARGVRLLGTLEHLETPDEAGPTDLLTPLLDVLSQAKRREDSVE